MKQACSLWNVWFTWLGIPALAVGMWVVQGWWAAVLVLLAGAAAQVFYVREFPRMSRMLGYGSVDDTAIERSLITKTALLVTLYTANVCPFCPIVKRRLTELQSTIGFKLKEIDITFQPNLVREKGFRSVPVVEVDGRLWIGNATSAQLAAFITKRN